jgi:hypothetical protein
MRKTYLLLAGVGAVVLAACSGDKKAAINDDLKKDLELASSNDGISLANSSGNTGTQVVSAIEQTAPPTHKPTPSTRVRQHHPAPKSPPQVVETEAPAAIVAEIQPQPVAPEPAAPDPTPVSPRPRPVAVSYPSGSSSGGGDAGSGSTGSTTDSGIGSILGAVIRGGVIGDDDQCDPRTDGRAGRRSRTGILINNRIPFPVPGRVGGARRAGGPSVGGIQIRIPR